MKVDYKIDTFRYFKFLHPGINDSDKTILDYGCNYGTFLDSEQSRILSSQYTGIDVDSSALDVGKTMFPSATFIHSNYYNCLYNPTGVNTQPILSKHYDSIISYSVLTHTTIDDFIIVIDWLYQHLNSGGKMLISYLNADHAPTVNYFRSKRISEYGYCDSVSTSNFAYMIDNRISPFVRDCQLFLLFLNKDYLANLLQKNGYTFTLHDNIPVNGCFQSCIVIDK